MHASGLAFGVGRKVRGCLLFSRETAARTALNQPAERLSFIFQRSNQVVSDTVPKHLCREAGRMKGALERQENQNQAGEPPALIMVPAVCV